jgi:hypothetical protein
MCERDCKRVSESVTFATELLREVKTSARRWFIAFMVMVILEVATIIGFLWYISLPTSKTTDTEISQKADDGSSNQIIGGDYNVSETDNPNNENN